MIPHRRGRWIEFLSSLRDFEHGAVYPALKCWAIFGRIGGGSSGGDMCAVYPGMDGWAIFKRGIFQGDKNPSPQAVVLGEAFMLAVPWPCSHSRGEITFHP